jgi:hypothetical protein
MQTKSCRNRQLFLCFGIAGRRDVFFIGWRAEEQGTTRCLFYRLAHRGVLVDNRNAFYLPQVSPFSRGGESRDVKEEWRTPQGQRLESHTKILT